MKKTITILLIFTLLFSLVSCGSTPKTDDTQDSVTLIDQAGDTVTVPKNAERIAVCGIFPLPSVITVFFDSGNKLVGIPPEAMAAAKNGLLGQLYPEILDAETGYISGTDINTEELLSLSPDIVFYSADNKKMGETLKNAGFSAVGISANLHGYNSIKTLSSWFDILEQIYPENERAKMTSEYSEQVLSMISERTATLSESERKKVFFLYKYSESTIMTSGANFFGGWWLDAIGAENVADELSGDNQQTVNIEQVYTWNPEIIFITNFNTAFPEDLYKNTVGAYNWSGIDAVNSKKVYKMPLGMYRSFTPGVDTPITLLWMAKTVYPDLFSDIDIIKETKDYYKTLFGITLTDEQTELIFNPSEESGITLKS